MFKRDRDRYYTDIEVAAHAATIALLIFLAFLLFAGCASTTGFAGGVVDSAGAAGYEIGIGALVDVTSASGIVRPRVTTRLAYQPKDGADSGHTYSSSLGLQVRPRNLILEAGWFAAGYESRFADGAVWKKDISDWYARVGVEFPRQTYAATYYPPSSDQYDSDQVTLDLRWRLGSEWQFIFQPSWFRLTLPSGKRDTGRSLLMGYGRTW
jgi:hypothetical protein